MKLSSEGTEGYESELGAALDRQWKEDYCAELLLRHGVDGTEEQGKRYKNNCINTTEPFSNDYFSISLSGGGARSASFSMGVLKALSDLDILEKANSISSVSGGGYAAYWYYMQKYYQYIPVSYDRVKPHKDGESSSYYANVLYELESSNAPMLDHSLCKNIKNDQGIHSSKDIFRTPYDSDITLDSRFQTHISQQSDIINYSKNTLAQWAESIGLISTHIASVPFYWITDGLLEAGVFNGSVLTNAYRKGLERTYGLVPNMEYEGLRDYFEHNPDEYRNGKSGAFLWWRDNARVEELHFRDMRSFSKAYNYCISELNKTEGVVRSPISMPIVNTNIKRPATFFKDENQNDSRSLEKSVFTFTPIAWGSEYKGFLEDQFRWAPVGVSKAYAISGAAADKSAREATGILDVLLELGNANLGYDIRNPEYGYKSDNYWYGFHKFVGGFPLGYFVPESKKPILHLSDGGHAENLGAYSLIRRGTKRMIVVDAEHDPEYKFDALNRLKTKLESELGLKLNCVSARPCPIGGEFLSERASTAVFPLEVTGLVDLNGQPKNIGILYVKLSIDQFKVSNPDHYDSKCSPTILHLGSYYPCHVAKYYLDEKDKENNGFPQNATFDIWYQKDQYQAFRDLGYYVAITELSSLIDEYGWREGIRRDQEKEKKYIDQVLN